MGYLGNSLAVWCGERFVLRLRARVFGHPQKLPPDFYRRHRTGDLVERLTGDVEAIEQTVVSGVVGARGRVAESGSHAELLAARGTYAALHRAQNRPGGDSTPGAASELAPAPSTRSA